MSTQCIEYGVGTTERFHNYAGKIRRFMDVARRAANQSNFPDYRHGAVLVKGNKIRNVSFNKDNYCSFGHRFRQQQEGHATLHAELGVILGLDRNITEGATIYVARVDKSDDFRLSKPCPMCHEAMKHVGVRRVVYTINGKTAGSYKL
jgi:deoxycytidylate deaminase